MKSEKASGHKNWETAMSYNLRHLPFSFHEKWGKSVFSATNNYNFLNTEVLYQQSFQRLLASKDPRRPITLSDRTELGSLQGFFDGQGKITLTLSPGRPGEDLGDIVISQIEKQGDIIHKRRIILDNWGINEKRFLKSVLFDDLTTTSTGDWGYRLVRVSFDEEKKDLKEIEDERIIGQNYQPDKMHRIIELLRQREDIKAVLLKPRNIIEVSYLYSLKDRKLRVGPAGRILGDKSSGSIVGFDIFQPFKPLPHTILSILIPPDRSLYSTHDS